MYLFCTKHLLCTRHFTHITFSQPPREPALCRCDRPSCSSTTAAGLVAFPCLCAILEATTTGRARTVAVSAAPVRQEGSLGTEVLSHGGGSNSCRCRARGRRPRGADQALGPRGGAARGGARGAGRRRGGGTRGSGSAGRGSPAPRAASVWRRRAGRSRGAKSGAGAQVLPPPPPAPVQPGSPRRRPPMEFT